MGRPVFGIRFAVTCLALSAALTGVFAFSPGRVTPAAAADASPTSTPASTASTPAPAPPGGLPDGRVYELVTSTAGSGGPAEGVSGLSPTFLAASPDGEAVDWEGFGGCCGASSGGLNLYRSVRGPTGWRTEALTPAPPSPLAGLAAAQAPMSWSSDLERAVFATPAAYAPGDRRPQPAGAEDLYLEQGSGAMAWISQGPAGTGSSPVSSEFDGATPDLEKVVFSSAEPLTTDAKGLGPENTPPQYLYLRDIATETTTLLNVATNDAVTSEYGAALGNGGWLNEEASLPAGYTGTTTNAISDDGAKVFFEAPPPGDSVEGASEPHLYMRNLATDTTTPLDEPGSSGSATYEGASADGSLVFFDSDEGLDGASEANELYEFNTTSTQIGPAPAMSAIAIGGGRGVVGETAIANDGSTVYFVSDRVLAANANPVAATAEEGEPNLYSYDTGSGLTTYVATLAWSDVSACDPICAKGHPAGLVAQPDTARPAYPTPDGSVLAFASSADLTGQAGYAETTLTSGTGGGGRTLTVASTSGFEPGQTIAIGTGPQQELDTVEAVDAPDQLTVAEYGPDGALGLVEDRPAGTKVQWLHTEVYRYSASEGLLACVSCGPPSATPTGSASLGQGGAGGSYAPANHAAPLSENGAVLFFESPDPLVPEAQSAPAGQTRPPDNVYEWQAGQVHLISDGSTAGFTLDGTTSSGDDVYFTTKAELTGIDTNGDREIYDARVGGGFSEGATPEEPCEGEACQTAGAGNGSAPGAQPLPGSEILGVEGGLEEQGPPAIPKVAIAKTTAKQRLRFARDGRLLLTVTASGPTTVTVNVDAKIDGRTKRVASGGIAFEHATTASLGLTLDAAARRVLASAGTLRLSLQATDSPGGPQKTFVIVLHKPASSGHAGAVAAPADAAPADAAANVSGRDAAADHGR